MSAESWPHGEYVSSARDRRIAAFYTGADASYASLADMRELIELGLTVDEVAESFGVSAEKVRSMLGLPGAVR